MALFFTYPGMKLITFYFACWKKKKITEPLKGGANILIHELIGLSFPSLVILISLKDEVRLYF